MPLSELSIDTRGMWRDEYAATRWAFVNLFPQCKETDQMVAIQVSTGPYLWLEYFASMTMSVCTTFRTAGKSILVAETYILNMGSTCKLRLC